eukprot:2519925-Pleurochrysis_carterae.AAC.2
MTISAWMDLNQMKRHAIPIDCVHAVVSFLPSLVVNSLSSILPDPVHMFSTQSISVKATNEACCQSAHSLVLFILDFGTCVRSGVLNLTCCIIDGMFLAGSEHRYALPVNDSAICHPCSSEYSIWSAAITLQGEPEWHYEKQQRPVTPRFADQLAVDCCCRRAVVNQAVGADVTELPRAARRSVPVLFAV